MANLGPAPGGQSIRRALGLTEGSRVSFTLTDGATVQMRATTGSVRDLEGIIPWDGDPVTVEEMDEAVIRGANGS